MVPHIREGATPLRPWNFSSSSGKGVFQHYRPRPRRVVVFRANATSRRNSVVRYNHFTPFAQNFVE